MGIRCYSQVNNGPTGVIGSVGLEEKFRPMENFIATQLLSILGPPQSALSPPLPSRAATLKETSRGPVHLAPIPAEWLEVNANSIDGAQVVLALRSGGPGRHQMCRGSHAGNRKKFPQCESQNRILRVSAVERCRMSHSGARIIRRDRPRNGARPSCDDCYIGAARNAVGLSHFRKEHGDRRCRKTL